MKKLEFFVSDDRAALIDKICDKEGYTRAEFNRRAVEKYMAEKAQELGISIKKD